MRILTIDSTRLHGRSTSRLIINHDYLPESEDPRKRILKNYHAILLGPSRYFNEGEEEFFRLIVLLKKTAKIPLLVIVPNKLIQRYGFATRALKAGADDIQPESIPTTEIIARLYSIVRRSCGYASSTIRLSGIEINLETHLILIHNKDLELTPYEYNIVEVLILNSPNFTSKDSLLDYLNVENTTGTNIIAVYISKLRTKFRKSSGDPIIKTRKGWGFYIVRKET